MANNTLRWAVVAAAGTGAVLGAWVDLAQGDPPPRVQSFSAHLTNFETVWIATPPQATRFLMEGDPSPTWLVRWDGARAIGMLETWDEGRRWSWYGGQASHGVTNEASRFYDPPTFYGTAVDAEVAALWEEVRSGLPRTTFTDVTAQAQALDLRIGAYEDREYRLDLPFAWDDGYEVYLALDESGDPTAFAIRETGAASPWIYAGSLDVAWNVPLRDDFDDREGYVDADLVGGPRWHVTGATTHRLLLDTTASLLDPAPPIQHGVADYRVHAWDTACLQAGTTTRAVRFKYKLDPGSLTYQRAMGAMAANCPMYLRTVPESLLQTTGTTKARFDATLTVRSGGGAVLSQTTAAAAATPGVQTTAWTVYDRKVLLPPSAAADPGLTFELAGTLTLVCKGAGPPTNRVAAAEGGTELLWPACYPEFGTIPPRP